MILKIYKNVIEIVETMIINLDCIVSCEQAGLFSYCGI